MNKVKYNSDSMKLMTLLESMTGAKVKDCILDEKITLIIEENDMGKAIGKNGVNIKRMEALLKKKIKLVEFKTDVVEFVKNMVYPVEAADVSNDDGIITVHGKDANAKAMLIGRNRKNVEHLKGIVKRYFNVKEINVV